MNELKEKTNDFIIRHGMVEYAWKLAGIVCVVALTLYTFMVKYELSRSNTARDIIQLAETSNELVVNQKEIITELTRLKDNQNRIMWMVDRHQNDN